MIIRKEVLDEGVSRSPRVRIPRHTHVTRWLRGQLFPLLLAGLSREPGGLLEQEPEVGGPEEEVQEPDDLEQERRG